VSWIGAAAVKCCKPSFEPGLSPYRWWQFIICLRAFSGLSGQLPRTWLYLWQQHLRSISAWLAANFGTPVGQDSDSDSGSLTGSTWWPSSPLLCIMELPRMFSFTEHVHSARMRVCTRKKSAVSISTYFKWFPAFITIGQDTLYT